MRISPELLQKLGIITAKIVLTTLEDITDCHLLQWFQNFFVGYHHWYLYRCILNMFSCLYAWHNFSAAIDWIPGKHILKLIVGNYVCTLSVSISQGQIKLMDVKGPKEREITDLQVICLFISPLCFWITIYSVIFHVEDQLTSLAACAIMKKLKTILSMLLCALNCKLISILLTFIPISAYKRQSFNYWLGQSSANCTHVSRRLKSRTPTIKVRDTIVICKIAWQIKQWEWKIHKISSLSLKSTEHECLHTQLDDKLSALYDEVILGSYHKLLPIHSSPAHLKQQTRRH